MAKVFVSYDREDLKRARYIANILEKAGHSVWMDRQIQGGAQFAKEIEQALSAAEAIIVLWSERSVESAWVRDEAAAGRDTGRLVPIRLDAVDPPLGFRQFQTIDLPSGRAPRASREALLSAVHGVAGTAPSMPAPSTKVAARASLPHPYAWITIGALVVLIIAGFLFWRPWTDRGVLLLSVGPGSPDAASHALARDLATKLGALQISSAVQVRLVESKDSSMKAYLAFEASSSGPANATLVLKQVRDASILWSRDFKQLSYNRADLLQQLAYTAGNITGCATEALDGAVKLKHETLKKYLNVCAHLSEISTNYDEPPIPMLHELVETAPRFAPAWSKLLLVEADFIASQKIGGKVDRKAAAELQEHIADARKIEPDMPEAIIAEGSLIQSRDFGARSQLATKAAEQAPDNPEVLMYLAGSLAETGQTGDAVEAASRAARLAPLSPSIHSNYTSLIAYSGAFDAAKRELAKAEKLWPGTESLWDAKYRFHYRYGDPRIARALFEQKSDSGGGQIRLFLDARENPTKENIETYLSYVRERLQNMENPSAGIASAVLAFAHFRSDEVFPILMTWPNADDIANMADIFFRPEFREVRRDPRFLQIAKRAGLLEHWVSSGEWPDFCYESNLPYDCSATAAKLTN